MPPSHPSQWKGESSRVGRMEFPGIIMKTMLKAICTLIVLAVAASSAGFARDNLASRATRLEPLVLRGDLSMSVAEYRIETGKYYRWRIKSDGSEEFLVRSPELVRNSWINQVVIDEIEVLPMGGLYGIAFDDAGVADVWFVPIRPGAYEFWVEGHRERGMVGRFLVD